MTLRRSILVTLVALATACGGSSPSRTDGGDGSGDDPCDACTADQVCIQRFNGTCGLSTSCVRPSAVCPDQTCSAACESAYCPRPYQCGNRAPCGTESPDAFTCYGP